MKLLFIIENRTLNNNPPPQMTTSMIFMHVLYFDAWILQGSSTDLTPSKLPNGNVHMSSASITYPQRIHSITQQYITNTGYLVQAHDFWEQADSVMQEVKGQGQSLTVKFWILIQDDICYCMVWIILSFLIDWDPTIYKI